MLFIDIVHELLNSCVCCMSIVTLVLHIIELTVFEVMSTEVDCRGSVWMLTEVDSDG